MIKHTSENGGMPLTVAVVRCVKPVCSLPGPDGNIIAATKKIKPKESYSFVASYSPLHYRV